MAGKKKTCGGARTKAATIVFAAAFTLVSIVPFFIIGTADMIDGTIPIQLDHRTRDFLLSVNERIGRYDGYDGSSTDNVVVRPMGESSRSSPLSLAKTPPAHVPKDFFFLNCPKSPPFPRGSYRIALVYRVNVSHNWEEILRDQMHTLVSCGLGDRANSFDVLVVSSPGGGGGEPPAADSDIEMVSAVLREYDGFIVTPQIVSIGTDEGQSDTVAKPDDRLREVCQRQGVAVAPSFGGGGDGGNETTTIVFHFRNTGALTFHSDWRQHKSITDEGPYSRSLYWRKYAEWFLLERPQNCIESILRGSWTCGVNVKTHESNTLKYTPDDMWAASCNHILTRAIPAHHISPEEGSLTIGLGATKSLMDFKHHSEQHKTKKDFAKQLVYPEEYDETASRFRLMCPNDPFPKGKYKVAMGYHVGMIKNWREVVSDQLRTLSACGLGKKASTFLVSYSKGDPEELGDLISTYPNIAAKPTIFNATKSPWECPMNTALRDFCKTVTEPTVVFYFHNKGVSKYRDDWRSRMDVRRTYAKSLYWRKLIEFFLIERPTLCVNKILNGAKTCGMGIRGRHQSGNTWVASCDYLAKLPSCDGENYIDSEFWLQKGMGQDDPRSLPDTYAQMWQHRKNIDGGAAKDQLLNLYQHLALPEEYANESYLDRSMMMDSRTPQAGE